MQTDGDTRPTAAGPGAPSRGDATWHVDCVFLLVAIAVLLIARIPVIPVRFFDPDEFEHSHAAWSVFRGQLPYRDFFEHHTPWYYYLLSPFFRWFAVDQSFESARGFLLFARALSLVLTALSVVLVFLVGRLGGNRKLGLLTALFLVGLPVVIQKTLEIRPDVPALPFFIGGLWFLLRGLRDHEDSASLAARGKSLPSPKRAEPARLLRCSSVKYAEYSPSSRLAAGPAAPISARSDFRHGLLGLRWFLGGGFCFGAAIMCTQKMLFVLPGALTALAIWALAGGRSRSGGRILAVLMVLVGIAIPVAVTWIAFAVQGAGSQFIHNNFLLNAKWRMRSSRHVLVTLRTSWPILALGIVGATVAMRGFYQAKLRAKQRQYGDVLLLCTLGGLIAGVLVVPAAYRQYYLPPLAIACVFAAKGLLFLVELAQERARARLLVWGTVLLLIWPVVDLGRSLITRRDDRQMARLRYVFEHTGPADTVLDGWLGTQVFRPHPLYYFFMHRELLAMLSEEDKEAYLGPLESGRVRPSLITVDDEMLALGPRFMDFVRRDYVSTDGVFYRPATPR